MPTADQEAREAARAAAERGENEFEAYQTAYERGLAERQERLKRDASASSRAMDGWSRVGSEADWQRIVVQASEDFESGAFLLERLGAERYLDPPLAAVLLGLRRRLIEEHRASTAAELLLIDSIVLAHYHQLQVTGWIGNLSRWLEAEFFGQAGLTAVTAGNGPRRVERVRGLVVEQIVERLVDRLMPLLDRSNKIMLRNLAALRALREGAKPGASIRGAGQVNGAADRVNAAAIRAGAGAGSPGGRRRRTA